jgi:hypothetical protein
MIRLSDEATLLTGGENEKDNYIRVVGCACIVCLRDPNRDGSAQSHCRVSGDGSA